MGDLLCRSVADDLLELFGQRLGQFLGRLIALDIVARCRKAGMTIEHEMKSIGTITGSIDESALEKLSRVKGVSQVEPERSFQIAPPDSDVQ